MDSDSEETPTDGSSAVALEKFFKEPDTMLPASVDVVEGFKGWKEQESIAAASRVLLVGVQGNQVVRMTDDTGGDFEESLPFQRCKFLLLQADKPWLDNVVYDSVQAVMRLPDEQRPEYLRTCRGFLFSAEEGLSTDEILYVTKQVEVNSDGEECAAWSRLAASDAADVPIAQRKRTKVLIPLEDKSGSGYAFDTVADPRHHHLQDLVDMSRAGTLKFPVRVKPVDVRHDGDSPVEGAGTLPNYIIVGLTETQWLVGIELDAGTFFRVPLAMAARLTVRPSQLRASDLKLCMHAVLESLADTDLRVIGPQAEGSLSALVTVPSTPIMPKRTPPEGMQQSQRGDDGSFGSSLAVPGAAGRPPGAGEQAAAAADARGKQVPSASWRQERGKTLAGGTADLLKRSRSAAQLRSTGSLRRFSTPAVLINTSDVILQPASVPEETVATAKVAACKGVAGWDVARVITELDGLGMSQYGAQFQREGVDGDLFVQLDDEMLRDDFGVSNRFHRLKLMSFVRKCR